MFVAGGPKEVLREYFRRRFLVVFFVSVVFVMGVLFGTIAVGAVDPQQRASLAGDLQGLFRAVSGGQIEGKQPFQDALVNQVLRSAGLMWLLGLSVIGAPLVLAVVFYRGFIIGFSVGFMVDQMVYKGMLMAVVSILPHNLFALPAVILVGSASAAFSISAFKAMIGRGEGSIAHQFLGTTLLTLAGCALLAVAAAVQAYVTPALMEWVGQLVL